MWTNFCRFLPYDLKEQIRDLDKKVVEYLLPLLLKESQKKLIQFYKILIK